MILWQVLAGLLKFSGDYLEDWDRGLPETYKLLDSYDFIIVGAGSAGCVLANRLTENPDWTVLLIEAGYDSDLIMDIPLIAPILQLTSANWNYTTEPSNSYCLAMTDHRCRIPRGKVVGGSSVLNYMIFTRGNRRDYDNWASLGNPEWSYEKVLPYFKKLETFYTPDHLADPEFRGSDGPLGVCYPIAKTNIGKALVKANMEYGIPWVDYNGETQTGVSFLQVSQKDGLRHSVSDAYLQPIRKRTNLHIIKQSQVEKIIFDGTRATGVLVERTGQRFQVHCTKEVILSAGAIGSPQILMLSGIGPREHLESLGIPVLNDLPVGRNLMDHIAAGLTFRINQTLPYSVKSTRAITSLPNFLNNRQGILTLPGGCEAVTFYDSTDPQNPDGYPDIELLYISAQLTMERFITDIFGIDHKHLKDYTPLNSEGFTIFPMVLRPKSKGYVQLRDTNPKSPPVIVPNYLSHPDDVMTMVKAIKLAMKLMKQRSLQKNLNVRFHKVLRKECPYSLAGKDQDRYFECLARHNTITIYHQSGTCRMGPEEDPRSVVNERLEVHGMQGLRVVDASIMPEIIAGHTNAPSIMIGERASDLIKEDYDFQNA